MSKTSARKIAHASACAFKNWQDSGPNRQWSRQVRSDVPQSLFPGALGGPHGFLERGLQVAKRYGVAGALARLVVRWPAPSSNWLAEDLLDNYPDAMSNVGEIITAVTQLSPAEQWDIYQWLNESPAITRRRLDALREDVALGLAQADRGDVAPFDIEAVKAEVRRHLAPTAEG